MKKIIFCVASALALLVATPAISQTGGGVIVDDTVPVSQEEVNQRLLVCSAYLNNQIQASKIIEVYKLDNPRKRRDFELQCQMAITSFTIGYESGREDARRTS